jgi:hypothetical protein
MWSIKSQVAAVAVLGVIALGCMDEPPTGHVPDPAEPRFDFTNGPSDLPNVIRFEEEGGVGVIYDPETDLLLLVGLPENPADAFDCGGTEPFDRNAVQVVGILREVFKVLLKSEPHLHVYQGSTFTGFCSSVPLAQGMGRLILNDNDAAVSGTRTNSFGASVTGQVTFASGGTAQLSAHVHFLIARDGTFREVSSAVQLSR